MVMKQVGEQKERKEIKTETGKRAVRMKTIRKRKERKIKIRI